MAKHRKPSALKDFAKQYRVMEYGGYKYIECPRPPIQFLLSCAWMPLEEDSIAKLKEDICAERVTLFGTQLGFYYSLFDRCYYVIDHLWMASLASWCPLDMQLYLRTTFATMLKNSHAEPVVEEVKAAPNLFKPITEEDEKKAMVVAKVNPLLERVTHAVEKEIALDKEIETKLSYYDIYGVPEKVFKDMQLNCITINGNRRTTVEKNHVHILDICKILYTYNRLPMADIYELLKSHKVIEQSEDKKVGKYHIFLKKKDWGYTATEYDPHGMPVTDYPVFNRKGVLNISMMLMDSSMIDKHILLV